MATGNEQIRGDLGTPADDRGVKSMTQVRRTIRFICALALTIGSVIALAYLLFYADGYFPALPSMATVLALVGVCWLLEDLNKADPRPKK